MAGVFSKRACFGTGALRALKVPRRNPFRRRSTRLLFVDATFPQRPVYLWSRGRSVAAEWSQAGVSWAFSRLVSLLASRRLRGPAAAMTGHLGVRGKLELDSLPARRVMSVSCCSSWRSWAFLRLVQVSLGNYAGAFRGAGLTRSHVLVEGGFRRFGNGAGPFSRACGAAGSQRCSIACAEAGF